ncbi:hypothetical protein, partial [Algoriphagus sp.]
LIFLAYLVGRPMTEAASILKFNICYIAYSTLLVEMRIIILAFLLGVVGRPIIAEPQFLRLAFPR